MTEGDIRSVNLFRGVVSGAENGRVPRPKILVVDNYDSFVYNLVQYLAQIGAEVDVWRNDDPRFADPGFSAGFNGMLLSPGPGTPEEAGVCVEVVRSQAGRLPIFGVCLGLQSIGVAYGGVVDRAPELLHGKTSLIHHQGIGVLTGLPSPFTATRYHSLAIEPATLPSELEVTATTVSGVIMAVRHRDLEVEAVQFHPESVLTEGGYQMLANWLAICGDDEAPARAAGMAPLMSAR
jgi:para-aminobenzoate synthetase component II